MAMWRIAVLLLVSQQAYSQLSPEVQECKDDIETYLSKRSNELVTTIILGNAERDTLAKQLDEMFRFSRQKIRSLGNDPSVQHAAAKSLCEDWYAEAVKNPINTTGLLPCPCDLETARNDSRFKRDPFCYEGVKRCNNTQPGSFHCVINKWPSKYGTGQQCCYREDGTLFAGPMGGGRSIKAHIDGHSSIPFFAVLISFYKLDVLPCFYCCKWSGSLESCESFYELRPPDTCENYTEPPIRPPGGKWQPDSYWSGAWGDPHLIFETGPEDDRFNLCFEWIGNAGEIYQYVTETSKGVEVNAKFIDMTTPPKNTNHVANSGSGKIVGELVIMSDAGFLHIFPDHIIANNVTRMEPWTPQVIRWEGNGVSLVLNIISRRLLEVIISGSGIPIELIVARAGEHIDFYIQNANDLPGSTGGLMGAIMENVQRVEVSQHNPEIGDIIVGRHDRVRARYVTDNHGNQCWHVPANGKALLEAEHAQRFLMKCLYCK